MNKEKFFFFLFLKKDIFVNLLIFIQINSRRIAAENLHSSGVKERKRVICKKIDCDFDIEKPLEKKIKIKSDH